MKSAISFLLAIILTCLSGTPACAEETLPESNTKAKVVVIPIRDQIDKPILYILRRGLKQAIADEVDTVILDMETPGGALDVTFEILKALAKFPGKTVTYVHTEAISAGALISAGTDEIWFSPDGVIGAAAPVLSTGAEIDETMKAKIVSYLTARVRSISEGKGYRGQVISAMINIDSELKIDDKILKKKGELLSLTAKEACTTYGDPPTPLLGAGIADDLDAILTKIHGAGNYTVQTFEVSWSERLAQHLTKLTPLLVGLGLLGIFIEFKTPGFGVFGAVGIILLGIVFFGHNVAGLSGNGPMVFFVIGMLLLAVEIFVFPGTFVAGITGASLMFGSLVWAMIDLWPGEPVDISGDIILWPMLNIFIGFGLAVSCFVVLLKFLPKGGPWGGLILNSAVGGEPAGIHSLHSENSPRGRDLIGQTATAATTLVPSGQIEINGRRYEAKLEMGFAEKGAAVKITGVSEFGLTVEIVS